MTVDFGFLCEPLFIPRVSYNDPYSPREIVARIGERFELLQVPGSSLMARNTELRLAARASSKRLWIDLDTERMPNPVVDRRQGLASLLNTLRGSGDGPLDFSDLDRDRKGFIRRAVEFQQREGASIIQAPAFNFSTPYSLEFAETVNCARMTADETDAPIIAKVTTIEECIVQSSYRDAIEKAYGGVPVAFFYVTAEHRDDITTYAYDSAYIDLIRRLSRQAPVFAGSVGFFGLVCVGSGAAGFGAGITGAESYSRVDMSHSRSGRIAQKYHVDQLLMAMKPKAADHLILPHYPCPDHDCRRRAASELEAMDRYVHRISVYTKHLRAMARLSPADKKSYMRDLVASAIANRQANNLLEKDPLDHIHENVWARLLA